MMQQMFLGFGGAAGGGGNLLLVAILLTEYHQVMDILIMYLRHQELLQYHQDQKM